MKQAPTRDDYEELGFCFFKQEFTGSPDGPEELRGDCDRTALATLLQVFPADIPRFMSLRNNDYLKQPAWLATTHRVQRISFTYERFGETRHYPEGLCLLIGQSPRGEWDHTVVGTVFRNEEDEVQFYMIHDPHPSGLGIVGIKFIEYVMDLRSYNHF